MPNDSDVVRNIIKDWKRSTLFEDLRRWRCILVSGPHRAGTTFASAVIAGDLGYRYFSEGEVSTFCGSHDHYYVDYHKFFAAHGVPLVIHCPSHAAYLHRYADVGDAAIVFMCRDIDDIIASQRRVGWGFEMHQLNHYKRITPPPVSDIAPPIAAVKYDYWDQVQKPLFGGRAIDLEYESLSEHPMWVDKANRADFWTAQLEVGKPRGARVQNPQLVGDPDGA